MLTQDNGVELYWKGQIISEYEKNTGVKRHPGIYKQKTAHNINTVVLVIEAWVRWSEAGLSLSLIDFGLRNSTEEKLKASEWFPSTFQTTALISLLQSCF